MTRYIQRHSLLARLTHGVAAISCIALAISGLFVLFPALSNLIGGEATHTIRMMHRVFAIPFILVPLVAMIKSPKGFVHLVKNNIFGAWDKDDFRLAKLFVPYLFMPGRIHMPPQHEVKGAQRLADGTLVFASVLLAISGLILWLDGGLLPGGGLQVTMGASVMLGARLVHDIAFLMIVVFGLGHMYLGGGIFQPYRGTANLMFGDGQVKESDAVYHWGYWANEELNVNGKNIIHKDK